jgi:hypothetical protein
MILLALFQSMFLWKERDATIGADVHFMEKKHLHFALMI